MQDDPLRDDSDVLVGDQPENVLLDPAADDALPVDAALDDDPRPVADEPPSAVESDDRPTTELPRVAAALPAQRSWTAGFAPWAVFAAVAVLVVAATSTWAAWLQGPTAHRQTATPRIVAPVPTLTAPAPPTPEAVAPLPEPEPAVEPEPEPEPVARATQRPRATRAPAPAPRVQAPPTAAAVAGAETGEPSDASGQDEIGATEARSDGSTAGIENREATEDTETGESEGDEDEASTSEEE